MHGRLRVRGWTSGEKSGITVEIEADAIGHDLAWGTSEFRRIPRGTPHEAEPAEATDRHPVAGLETDPAEGREPVGATPF